MAREERLMWTLEDWSMLLDHHLTERTSKNCMFYMGESVLKLEEKEMEKRVKKSTIEETKESTLKDWIPMKDDTLEKMFGTQNQHGRCSLYQKKKGGDYKTVVTMPAANFEIRVERRKYLDKEGKEKPEEKSNSEKEHLYYNFALAILMDCVITTFITGMKKNKMKERLNKAMELLRTLDSDGVKSVQLACSHPTHLAFRRLMKSMCTKMKNPFISKKNERSDLNRCVFFWIKDNGGEKAIDLDKKQMIAAVRAVAMGMRAFPLHTAITCDDLDAVVLLLANGVDPNAKNDLGDRPLWMALQNGFVNIVKALLLFGADPKKDVARGKSFQQAIYPEYRKSLEEVINIVDESFEYEATKMEDFEQRRLDKARIDIENSLNEGAEIHNLLSLDGGGIRGLVLIEIMDALEKKYGPALLDRFKWVAGTSTGAIMALALGQGKDIAECRRLYFRLKDLVFYRATKFNPYPAEPLENFLKREFVEQKAMKTLDNGASTNPQKRRKNVAVTTADYSETTAKLRLFRNYHIPDLTKDQNEKEISFKIWEAARSSSAAPLYFPPCASKYVDGGLIANNPVLPLVGDFVACQEAAALGYGSTPTAKPAKLGVVLSIGTGWKPLANAKELVPPEVALSSCQSFGIDVLDLPRYLRTSINTYKQMLKGLQNQILRAESSLQNARDWTFSLKGAFFRFNLNLDGSFKLDETNNVKLIDLMWKTRVHMRKMKTQVDLFVEMLNKTTRESDGKRSIVTQSTQSSHKSVKKTYPLEEYCKWDEKMGKLRSYDPATGEFIPSPSDDEEEHKRVQHSDYANMPNAKETSDVPPKEYIEYAREELARDPKVKVRVPFVQNSLLPDAIAMPNLPNRPYVKYIEFAREELANDPKVKARVPFVQNSLLLDAIPMPNLPNRPSVKYIEYAREELANDPKVQSRVKFIENSKKPVAKAMPNPTPKPYVKYIEYAREELANDPKVKARVPFVQNSLLPEAIPMPNLPNRPYVKYIEFAREELANDPKVQSRVKFIESSKKPVAKASPNRQPQEYVKYIEYAREELANDPKVKSRVKFVEHSNMPLAKEMPTLKPQVYVKYIEYAREELANDPNVRSRVQFVENCNLPDAIAMPSLIPREIVKYNEFAREEIEIDFNVQARSRFLNNIRENLPLAIETDDLPPPPHPSLDDIPDIDAMSDDYVDAINTVLYPTMYISPDALPDLEGPPKPARRT